MNKLPIFDQKVIADSIGIRTEVSSMETSQITKSRGLVLEAVLGDTSDFLPYSFLEEGMRKGKSVGRVVVRMDRGNGPEVLGHGTSFLVAPSILMTNAHVLPTPESALHSQVQFNYELDMRGNELDAERYALDPDYLFVSSPYEQLDFTLVGVKDKNGNSAGDRWGTVRLDRDPSKVMINEHINLIEHPAGRRKEVVLQENKIIGFFEGGYIRYTADTLKGSSGSPVFNNQWDLVALHHSGVYKRDEHGKVVIKGGEPQFESNEGIRISAIANYLQSNALTDEQRALIDQFL